MIKAAGAVCITTRSPAASQPSIGEVAEQTTVTLPIRPRHKAAILSRKTKKVSFYHAKPHPHGFHCEAWRSKTKLFWYPQTIWPPCDKGEFKQYNNLDILKFKPKQKASLRGSGECMSQELIKRSLYLL